MSLSVPPSRLKTIWIPKIFLGRLFGLFVRPRYRAAIKRWREKSSQQNSYRYVSRAAPSDIMNIPCCFVLSTGRCGTLLLTNLLKVSNKVLVEHNPKPTLEYVSRLVHAEQPNNTAQKLAILAARFDTYFELAFNTNKMYIETNNRISFFATALSELLPRSKFIHLVRDPAEFVRSGMRRGYYLEGVEQHQRLDGSGNPIWRSYSRLQKIAWEWNEINSSIENFKRSVEPQRVLTVKSELLWECETTVDQIFDFLDIDNPFKSSEGRNALAKILSRKVNAQETGHFPKYSFWSNHEKNSFRSLVPLSVKYGYRYS